jgi:hypothetical protein
MPKRKRYEAQRLHSFPCGSDTAHGIWDFHSGGFIRLDGQVWNTWDAGEAAAAAKRLNNGEGLDGLEGARRSDRWRR